MGMLAILFNGAERLKKKWKYPFDKGPCEIAEAVSEIKTFINYTILHINLVQYWNSYNDNNLIIRRI